MKTNLNHYCFVEYPDQNYPEKGIEKPVEFKFFWMEKQAGSFIFAPMPGCCGVVISTNSYLEPYCRGKHEISKSFHEIKAHIAKEFGYSCMLATTQLTNLQEVIGGAKNGWKFVETFRNKRTDHDLGVMVKKL